MSISKRLVAENELGFKSKYTLGDRTAMINDWLEWNEIQREENRRQIAPIDKPQK